MDKSLISIIIPTYNRKKLIGETLDSINAQTYKNWECIVVDDGSTDGTEELLNNYLKDHRFRFYKRPSNKKKGANACRNYGLELSTGTYIHFFDSDDLMAPNMLELKMKAIEGYDFSYCNCVFFKENDVSNNWSRNFEIRENLLSSYVSNEILFNSLMPLWRKESLKAYRFNENLSRAQELDFFSRILFENDFKGNRILEKLVFIREHSNSITSTYNDGGEKEIKDDLRVRKSIWLKSQKQLSSQVEIKTFRLFLYTVKIALKNKYFPFLFYQLITSLFLSKIKFKSTILQLIGVSFLFLCTGRGLMQFKKISDIQYL